MKETLLEKLKKELKVMSIVAVISILLTIYHSTTNFDDIAIWATFAVIAFFSAWGALLYVKAIKYRQKMLEQCERECESYSCDSNK